MGVFKELGNLFDETFAVKKKKQEEKKAKKLKNNTTHLEQVKDFKLRQSLIANRKDLR